MFIIRLGRIGFQHLKKTSLFSRLFETITNENLVLSFSLTKPLSCKKKSLRQCLFERQFKSILLALKPFQLHPISVIPLYDETHPGTWVANDPPGIKLTKSCAFAPAIMRCFQLSCVDTVLWNWFPYPVSHTNIFQAWAFFSVELAFSSLYIIIF